MQYQKGPTAADAPNLIQRHRAANGSVAFSFFEPFVM